MRTPKIKKFKIRCHAIGQIMGGQEGLTDKQQEYLDKLQSKETRTDKQQETLYELISKRDTPSPLLQTAKTHCEIWLKEQLYNRRKEFSSKHTEKGNVMEDNSIDFIANQLGYGMLLKNEQYFEDEWMTGTPDVRLPILDIDAKNSWDCFSFPLFETDVPNTDYYWQGQGYMALDDKPNYKVIYVLSDTPEYLIEREVYFYAKNNGYEDVSTEMYNEFVDKMTYDDIPNSLKIKVFDIKRNEKDIQRIRQQVIKCRNYIKILIDNLKSEGKIK